MYTVCICRDFLKTYSVDTPGFSIYFMAVCYVNIVIISTPVCRDEHCHSVDYQFPTHNCIVTLKLVQYPPPPPPRKKTQTKIIYIYLYMHICHS